MMNMLTCITSKNEMTEGLFGQVLLFIFEILPILESNNTDISNLKWDICTTNYGDIFPHVLEYNSEYIDPIKINNKIKLVDIRSKKPQYTIGDDFIKLNELFFKYFKIPQELENIVKDLEITHNLKECLGIHFRGTDKTNDVCMNNPISCSEFYIVIDSFIKNNNDIKNVFIATDEKKVIEYLKNKYIDINFVSSRDFNSNLFWKNNNNIIRNAREAMIDMLCLSKCKIVIKVSSALSAFSKLINPKLNIFRLNALKMFSDIPYFPDAYIPLFEKNNNYTNECNDIINKMQQNEWSINHLSRFNNFYYKLR